MEPQFLKWGPCYGWWVFAYERNNGWLGRTNNNGHSGGELEATMMRRWWKVIFIQDLLTHLESLPDPAPEDLDSIDLLKKHLQGGTNERGGTLQNYMARMAAENNPCQFDFPRTSRHIDLRTLGPGYYGLVFQHLKQLWKDDTALVEDINIHEHEGAETFTGSVRSYSHMRIKSLRYGAATAHRGKSARYAYINTREPVEIQYIFQAELRREHAPSLLADFALIRKFRRGDDLPRFPWDLWASDLGVESWYAEDLGNLMVVPLECFTGHLILAPITVRERDIWITVPYDHEKAEVDLDEVE